MNRRHFLAASASLAAFAGFGAAAARANVPVPYDWNAAPPMDNQANFVAWMEKNRGEDPKYLIERWKRYQVLVVNRDLKDERNRRAFLMTPRERFVREPNLPRAYANAFLDIGYGVTISGPHLGGRMTSNIDVQMGEKVLEIGTGSGYQSAYLSNLTDKVWSIEIIKPLAERTRQTYDQLIAEGYSEYKAITFLFVVGFFGWVEAAPNDKIIVT